MKKYWIEYLSLAPCGIKGNGDLVVHAESLDESVMKKMKTQVLNTVQEQDKSVTGLAITLIQEINY